MRSFFNGKIKEKRAQYKIILVAPEKKPVPMHMSIWAQTLYD